jgi:hypothetical protein
MWEGNFMLETTGAFKCKDTELETSGCNIVKIVKLSGAKFDYFSSHLLRDHDFIAENSSLMGYGENGKRNCLLVLGEGHRDGILVDSDRSNYARFTAFMPNAEDFLAMNQYPALAELNKKLTRMVDYIAENGGAGNPDGRGVIDLQDSELTFGIDFMINGHLRSTALEMLNQRPEIRDWELDGGQLIVWRDMGDALAVEDYSDPTVSLADMYAYGYTWDGMIPLGKERALELFDAGHQIFRLYEDGAEGAIDTREEVLAYSGLFGTEDPEWEQPARDRPLEVFIVNSEKHRSGENIGEWLTLPADAEALQSLLERIGVEKPSEADFAANIQSAFTITSLRMPLEEELQNYVNIHDSLDQLNTLASCFADLGEHDFDTLQAILSTNVADLGDENIGSIINLLFEDNFREFDFIYVTNEEALGRYYADEHDEKPEEVSFEEHGRDCVKGEGGVFFGEGYIMHRLGGVSTLYDGVAFDDCKITATALRGLPPKAELGEKPSVMDEINASRKNARGSEKRAASKGLDVQKSKKNKGEADL